MPTRSVPVPAAAADYRQHVTRRAVVATVVLSAATMVVLALVFALVGLALVGALVGLGIAALVAAVVWTRSDRLVLRLGRAEPAGETAYARYHNVVEGLCVAGGLPKPALYVIDDEGCNGFVAGRGPKSASLAVTTGLLDALDRVQLEGVLAHLLVRVKSHEILAATVAVPTGGIGALLGDLCVRARGPFPPLGALGGALLAPSATWARLITGVAGASHLSATDRQAVALTRYPPGLVAALHELEERGTVVAAGLRSTAHLWLAAPISDDASDDALAARNREYLAHAPLGERLEILREL